MKCLLLECPHSLAPQQRSALDGRPPQSGRCESGASRPKSILGFRVWGFRVWGLGVESGAHRPKSKGLGSLGFRVWGLWGLGFRV